MNSGTATYNERSWAIDLIGHLKHLAARNNRAIKDAGGEQTVKAEGGHAENVICFDIAATQASMYETARQAIDNGMRDLNLALDALARHYGIAETGQSA